MSNVFPMPRGAFTLPRVDRAPRVISGNERDARVATIAPRIPWAEFIRDLDWNQGEHVALIGPTGSGKTSLLTALLPLRSYVAVVATKPADSTMDYLISHGYDKFDKWESLPPGKSPRRVIWPNARDMDSEEKQEAAFRHMYRAIYREGGWAIVVDEAFILSEVLKLKREMRIVWNQGRSIGITHIVGTQRPAWVPREMYTESTHFFFWKNRDKSSLESIGDMNGLDARDVREVVANLDKYQVLYVNRDGYMCRTTPPAPSFDTTGR
jgi:hypothetical protein